MFCFCFFFFFVFISRVEYLHWKQNWHVEHFHFKLWYFVCCSYLCTLLLHHQPASLASKQASNLFVNGGLRWSVAGSLLYFTAKGCLSITVIRFYYHIFPTNCLLISIFYASFGSMVGWMFVVSLVFHSKIECED